jgi:hypothetical protein
VPTHRDRHRQVLESAQADADRGANVGVLYEAFRRLISDELISMKYI